MQFCEPSCIKGSYELPVFFGRCVKTGLCKNGSQKLRCKSCSKYQLVVYANRAYQPETNREIYKLHREGAGIRGIARIMSISTATVMTRIKSLGKMAEQQKLPAGASHKVLEIDEMWTYIGKKENEVWVMYLMDRATHQVIDFRVGGRKKREPSAFNGSGNFGLSK